VALTETSTTLVTNQDGVYFLEVLIGQCPIYSNEIEVIECGITPVDPSDITAVPNVFTPNGDGINDQWFIPEIYTTSEVEVFIYSASGEILHQGNYNNDPSEAWPQTTLSHIKYNPVFYYRILRGSEVLEQGSLTLIK
jgi:gliding motility-associated-like protein